MIQEAVARDLGIDQRHLSKIELGKCNPSAPLLAKISEYYSRSVEELFPDIFTPKTTQKKSIDKNNYNDMA